VANPTEVLAFYAFVLLASAAIVGIGIVVWFLWL
jgi:hypothetical protein